MAGQARSAGSAGVLVAGAVDAAPQGQADARAAVGIAEEADDYSRFVDGVAIEAIRMGQGFGPNTVKSARVGDTIANSNTVRFPMAVYGTIGDDRVLTAAVRSAPPGARWCGIDIADGMVVVYGPGAEHTGANPAGLKFSFALLRADDLEDQAGKIGLHLEMPGRGQVHALNRTAEAAALHHTLCEMEDMVMQGVEPGRVEDAVMNAAALALSDDHRGRRVGARKSIDSRIVTRICIDYAESIGRIPAIHELCMVAHVSERRLRTAFNETYGMPPGRFFRRWGLALARRSLLRADRNRGQTVTDVAFGVGFLHLGKFAGSYKAAFGESPSATLAIPS